MGSLLVLSELLTTERVRVPLGSHTKAALLRELVGLALGGSEDATVDAVSQVVESREAEVSTAMGGGLAVPHGRTDLVSRVTVACGIVDAVPDYLAPDGSVVQVVFLVLTPVGASGAHVRLLAEIARLMHAPATRAALLAATNAEAFLQVVRRSNTGQRTLIS